MILYADHKSSSHLPELTVCFVSVYSLYLMAQEFSLNN